MVKKGQKFQEYTPELKMEAVRLYEAGGMSYKAAADKMGVRSNSQIC